MMATWRRPSLEPTRPRVGAYRLAVVGLAVLLIAWVVARPDRTAPPVVPLWGVAVLALLAVLAEQWILLMPNYGVVTMADAVYFGCMVLYGPAGTLLLAAAATCSRLVRERRTRRVSASYAWYSAAQAVLALGLASLFYAEYSEPGPFFADPRNLLAFGGAVGTCFLVQGVLTAVHQWLDQSVGVWGSRVNWMRLRLYLVVLGPLGLLLATAFEIRPVAVLLLLGPLAVTYASLKRYTDTLREARVVIESLADAVETRDPHTGGHSLRVAAYAEDIARELRLPETEVARIVAAGRLHDLGKISVADEVLTKLEELTDEEFASIRRHADVGAQVASQLSLSRDQALYIRHHHEWYDGSGYPDGLQGRDIPLGARILALAEAWDTMTTPRSYREALTREEALRKIEAGREIQFDPRVLDAFLAVLRRRG